MQSFLAGFADELTKLADENQSNGPKTPPSKYLKTMLLAAATVPAAKIFGRRVERFAHNKALKKAISKSTDPAVKAELAGKIESGKLMGPSFGVDPNKRPTMTYPELAGDSARGAVAGSVIQYLRDKMLDR